jgi:hypothetical protein
MHFVAADEASGASATVSTATSPSNATKMAIIVKARGGLLASLHAGGGGRKVQHGSAVID